MKLETKMLVAVAMMLGALGATGCNKISQQMEEVAAEDNPSTAPVDEAADGRHARAACVRHLGRVQDRLDRLFLGGVDEAARVDDHDVRTVERRAAVTRGDQTPHETVGVGFVLGAAERLDEERAARARPQR